MILDHLGDTIRCRSCCTDACYDGRPEDEVYEEGMAGDGTFDGETVICDPCYIMEGTPVMQPVVEHRFNVSFS